MIDLNLYEESYSVPRDGLSAGDLFRLIQRISGDHCRQIGYGETVMEEKGVMWVIIRHGVQLFSPLVPGGELLVKTWPGLTRHGLCPRYYRMETPSGELLLTGCAIWSVVDRESRKMVTATAGLVDIEPLVTGLESPRPPSPRRLPPAHTALYTVTEEVLDENGHMNNTRYYDLAESLLGTAGRPLRSAIAEYVAEARLGDVLSLSWAEEDGLFSVLGENAGSPAFCINLQYE